MKTILQVNSELQPKICLIFLTIRGTNVKGNRANKTMWQIKRSMGKATCSIVLQKHSLKQMLFNRLNFTDSLPERQIPNSTSEILKFPCARPKCPVTLNWLLFPSQNKYKEKSN
jgi:hypothetical protein